MAYFGRSSGFGRRRRFGLLGIMAPVLWGNRHRIRSMGERIFGGMRGGMRRRNQGGFSRAGSPGGATGSEPGGEVRDASMTDTVLDPEHMRRDKEQAA